MPTTETTRPRRLRLLAGLAMLLGLALPLPAAGFLVQYFLDDGEVSFRFDVEEGTQWELDDGDGNVYEGVLDKAEFSGNFGLVLKDKIGIERNGLDVEAELTGRIDRDCEKTKIKLKDKTNDRKFTLQFTGDESQACNSSE